MDGAKRFELALIRFEYYERIVDSLGAETIARFDREESGYQYGGCWEHEQGGGEFTFSALPRDKQAAILHALDVNLPTRNKRPNANAGTSYAIKHAVERFTGFYVSNLQAKVAMRILGYQRGGDDLNPDYNISKREWRAFSDLSRDIESRRSAARARVARREEQQAAARYFYKITKTA